MSQRLSDLLFVMHVHNDDDQLVTSNVNRINSLYPESSMVLIYDGVPVRGHVCVEIAGDRLKIAGKLGQWTERYLKTFLDTDKPYLIKIDPDTKVHRPIVNLPDPSVECIFCRMGVDRVPHGGALGFTRPMAERLLSSGWLHDPTVLRYHIHHAYQDQMLRTIVWSKKLSVSVRRDFGWVGHETEDTTFSHYGNYEPYLPDQFLPQIR
jgi:hypothetical protein